MADRTGISWADMTFNPWIGCAKVSPACDGCYADALMGAEGRHKRATWGGPGAGVGTRVRTKTWDDPVRWNKRAAAEGTRPFVFCASLADVFDNAVPPEWRRDLFDLIRATPNLTWLLLTKRPGQIVKLFAQATPMPWPRNAAIGCTVVNQEEADRDIPKLLAAAAGVKNLGGEWPAFTFLSMEPLLGPVDLTRRLESGLIQSPLGRGGVDWVITGGETSQGGHQARPQHPAWFRSLRDQCAEAGVAYHHKQNGEWAQVYVGAQRGDRVVWLDGRVDEDATAGAAGGQIWVRRVGKERSGRLLDGVTHDARPED